MKSYNKTIILTALLLVVAGNFSSCEKEKEIAIDWSKIDLSNIENLHEQPLPVIQKCVEGKWQWYMAPFFGSAYPTNTFVNITEKKCVETAGDRVVYTFSYAWKKKATPSGYSTYVMWIDGQNTGRYYFDSIKNDTLVTGLFNPDTGDYDIVFVRYVLVRFKQL